MSASSKLACLIAAGGTAGHVRPALAVAEALRERGVAVTFAGSRGPVESRLVPEAGFELETFDISGFPRRFGFAFVRSVLRALRAPLACLRILRRRRPDVVLGAGGYVVREINRAVHIFPSCAIGIFIDKEIDPALQFVEEPGCGNGGSE